MTGPRDYGKARSALHPAPGHGIVGARRVAVRPRPSTPADPIARRPAGEVAPASFGQEQIWLHSQLAPDVPLYTESLTIHRNGCLDTGALVAALRDVVCRHEIWRTTFAWSQGRLLQQVHAEHEPEIQVADLRHLPAAEREAEALELAREDLGRDFDLFREPGVRARLVTLSDTDHRLYLCLHHLVFDGISIYRVFLPELAALYEAKVGGSPSGLDELPLQYGDFAYWQRRAVDQSSMDALAEYWRRRLAGAPAMLDLPSDRVRPRQQSFRGGLVRFLVPVELTAAARRVALAEHCTLFMLLLASFTAALHRWSGQTDMVIGSVNGGRDRPELDRLIGYFLKMLVIRTDLSGDPTFREMLRRVRDALLDALCHDALPFQRLVHAVGREPDLGRSPLFQVTLSIEPPLPGLEPLWDLSEMDAGVTTSKFDLSVELEDRGDVIRGRAIYSKDLFESSTISDFVDDWLLLLKSLIADPGRRLAECTPARLPVGPH